MEKKPTPFTLPFTSAELSYSSTSREEGVAFEQLEGFIIKVTQYGKNSLETTKRKFDIFEKIINTTKALGHAPLFYILIDERASEGLDITARLYALKKLTQYFQENIIKTLAVIKPSTTTKVFTNYLHRSVKNFECTYHSSSDDAFHSLQQRKMQYEKKQFSCTTAWQSFQLTGQQLEKMSKSELINLLLENQSQQSQQDQQLLQLLDGMVLENNEPAPKKKISHTDTSIHHTICDTIALLQEDMQNLKKEYLHLSESFEKETHKIKEENVQLNKLNDELNSFIYSATHDLKAPLASILGLLTIAKGENDIDKIKEYLELKEKSVHKLDAFINDVLNLSKNARTEVEKEEIDIQQIVQDIFDEYEFSENSDKITKSLKVHQNISFHSDKKRLSIILSNLISNALRYSAIYRDNPFVAVTVEQEGNDMKITVQDNGQGIKEEHLAHIFEMFYRANQDKAGSGIGLYIVKETLAKLNGKVEVNSTLGEGTSFTLYIPNFQAE